MATQLATAYVQLVASGTGLPQSINQAVQQAVAASGPARVPIVPQVAGPTALSAAGLGLAPVPLPVTPQVAGPVTWQQIGGAAVPVPLTPTIPAGAAQQAGRQAGAAASSGFVSNLFGGPGGRGRFGTEFSREVQAAAQAAGGLGQRLSQQLAFFGPTGLAIGATTLAVGAAARSFASFETELNTFGVVADATNDQMERASELSKQLGADARLPGVSAGDAAVAMTELTKAGIDVNNTFAATPGVLELATAAQIDNASAADLTASALNAFGLAGNQATHVADTLAGASLAAQGEIIDMALALRQSAAVARLAGFDFDETQTALTVLARRGIEGSDAGTSLRTALLRLINPTTQAQKVLGELGVQIRDADGGISPEVFDRLRLVLERLDPATRQTALAMIFGADAIRSASFLTEVSTDQFRALETQITRSGQANEIAGARASGLAGSFADLSNQTENLGIAVGGILAPALESIIEPLAAGIGLASTFIDTIGSIPGIDLAFTGPGDIIRKINADIKELSGEDAQTIDELAASLTRLQASASGTDALTGQTFGINGAAIGELGRKLQTEIIDRIAELREQQRAGLNTVEINAEDIGPEIERLAGLLRGTLSPALQQVTTDSEGFEVSLADAAERQGRDLVNSTSGVVFDARDAGIRVGEGYGKGVGDGIKQVEDATVRQARESLRRVTEEGNQAVFDAVEDAKANLLSLGSSLGDQIGQIIDTRGIGAQATQLQNALDARRNRSTRLGLVEDLEEAQRAMQLAQLEAGPLASRIKALQDQLDRLGRRDERADLLSSQRDAQDELARARRAIQHGNIPVGAEQQRSINEFLRPFEDRARQAASALKRNDLQGQIDTLSDRLEAQKRRLQGDPFASYRRSLVRAKQAITDFDQEQIIAGLQRQAQAQKDTVTRGIQNILQQFNDGGIKLAQANQRIAKLIEANVGPYRGAGRTLAKEMGEAFNTRFLATIEGVQEQLEAIVLGPQRAGTTGARANVVRPRETLLQSLERRQEARDKLNDAIAKSNDNTDKGINGAGGVKDLLVQIRNELAPSGKYVQQGNK